MNTENDIIALCRELEAKAYELPVAKRLKVLNRTRLIRLALKKGETIIPAAGPSLKPYSAILAALKSGRRLSQLDCKEFQIEDMRTPVSHLRKRYEKDYVLQSRWISTPTLKRKIKEWWLEERPEEGTAQC